MYCTSFALKRVLTGTTAAPAPMTPSAATTHSYRLGDQIATRSPRSMPLVASAAVTRLKSATNSRYVTRRSPSITASTSPQRSAVDAPIAASDGQSRSPRTRLFHLRREGGQELLRTALRFEELVPSLADRQDAHRQVRRARVGERAEPLLHGGFRSDRGDVAHVGRVALLEQPLVVG